MTSFMFVFCESLLYLVLLAHSSHISTHALCKCVCDWMCVSVYLALNILGDCIPYNIAFICVTISYFMSHCTNMHWGTLQGWSVIGYGVYIVFVACAAFVLIPQAVCSPQFLCLIPMVTSSCSPYKCLPISSYFM